MPTAAFTPISANETTLNAISAAAPISSSLGIVEQRFDLRDADRVLHERGVDVQCSDFQWAEA